MKASAGVFQTESLPRSRVESVRDGLEIFGLTNKTCPCPWGSIGAGESVGVLIRAALQGLLGSAEENRYAGLDAELSVLQTSPCHDPT